MSTADIIRMANQIAQFFAPYPESDAVQGICDHFSKFWTVAMRRDLLTILQETPSGDAATLHPLAVSAGRMLAERGG